MRRLFGFFQDNYFFCVLAFAFCFGSSVAWGPATAAEMTPETQALFRAVRAGNMEAVRRSVLAGADVNWENADGLTPVDLAVDKRNFKIAHYLLIWRHNRQVGQRPRVVIEPPRAPDQDAPPRPAAAPTPVVVTEPAPPPAKEPAMAEPAAAPAPTPVVAMEPPPPPAKEPAVAEPAAAPAPTPVVATEPPPPPAKEPAVAEPAAAPAPTPVAAAAPVAPTAPVPLTPAVTLEEKEPVAEPEAAAGMFERITRVFSVASEEAETAPETEPAAVPEPETEPAPAPMAVTLEEKEPVAEPEAAAGMFERITRVFSVASEEAETAPETEPAAVPEPETEPAPAPMAVTPEDEEPVAEPEAGGMFERVAGFFSRTSEEAETASETEPAAVPEPEPPQTAPAPMAVTPEDEEPVAEPEGAGMFERVAGFFSRTSEEAETASETEPAVVPEPEPEPAPAPMAVTPENEEPVAEPEGAGMFERVAGFFSRTSEEAETAPETEPAVVPKPEPEQAAVPEPEPEPAPPPSLEPATATETALAGPVAAAARAPTGAAAARERRVDPVLGRSLRLGKPMAADSAEFCFEKGSRHFWFCIEPVDWPQEIAEAFQVQTILYRGAQAIVLYDGGGASQFHTLFPTRNFDAITAYFTERLGTPGKQFDNWAILSAEPNRVNRTVRWRGPGASVLEIRQIDDLRWSSLPDTKHGVVRIYGEDPAPVFRHVSWSDFMLARMSNVRR